MSSQIPTPEQAIAIDAALDCQNRYVWAGGFRPCTMFADPVFMSTFSTNGIIPQFIEIGGWPVQLRYNLVRNSIVIISE